MTANIGILRKIEPAILGKNGGFLDVEAAVDAIRALPKQTFGPIVLHPADAFYAFMTGVEYCVVLNYPSGGGILQHEIHTLWNIHGEKFVDLCMPHPGRVFNDGTNKNVRASIREAARVLNGMEYPLKRVRLLYDMPLMDDKLIDAICDEASTNGLVWVKTSTGVYSDTDIGETKRIVTIAGCYDMHVKVAGGISNLSEAIKHIKAGASAVGTSSWKRMYAEAGGRVWLDEAI